MKIIEKDLIGSDPEFFIQDNDGNMVSSIGIIEGTKSAPKIFDDGYAILKDNVLIEGNIPPAKTKEEFIENMRFLKSLMMASLGPLGYSLKAEDIGRFTEQQLNDPEARVFGCSSYYDAWNKKTMRAPEITENFRVAGFHIHISYNVLSDDDKYNRAVLNEAIARAFDYFVTMPSDEIRLTRERRDNYGAYGSFRDTPYGLECRSLGGYFTDDKFLGWVYDQTIKAIDFVANPENFEKLIALKTPSKENYKFLNIDLQEQILEIKKLELV